METKFKEAMEYIAGTCMISTQAALDTILDRTATSEEVEQFEEYLDTHDCIECEHCGWYTHPGETCDCEDEEEECYMCGQPLLPNGLCEDCDEEDG